MAAQALEKHAPTAAQIFADLTAECAPIFDQIGWAEDEIAAAQRRHRGAADQLWHCFVLLKHEHELMRREILFRAHCREILERVAAGHDTRDGTAAEVVVVLRAACLAVPLTSTGAGLYLRMWRAAGLPPLDRDGHIADQEHYEALVGRQIDDLEADLRHRLRRPDRVQDPDLTCCGVHNGTPVKCQYATRRPAPARRAPTAAEPRPSEPPEQLSLI
ncbi:hypothetical protein HLB23_28735 [Nocardia uniformis]|uniref:Uncharacterized protein n=1 Tax=Nocardia uniformis TaxID=53432 RepID=A0A849C520_9NOCA|nr:hypothetical protein [Nocardia uniformis]NNH73794.1 hypothetical protein [Nocardia uniformis]